MGRGSTVALALAAAALLVSLPMLLVSLSLRAADTDAYELETRRMFVEWKAKTWETYRHYHHDGGEEGCRYAVFKDSRRGAARAMAAGDTSSGINGFSATTVEEFYLISGVRRGEGEESYEQETRRVFVAWKAKYGKIYRDAGEEECRYGLFKGNRRVVVRLNAAAGRNVYGLNQFGDLTDDEVCERCYPEMMEDRELSARCQAHTDSRLIQYQREYLSSWPIKDTVTNKRQSIALKMLLLESEVDKKVCRCIATELKQTESGGSAIPGDEAHMWI